MYRCAPNGVFIRHLNLTPSSMELSQFNGVCIDTSGHIIVSDWQFGVHVSRASGEYVRLTTSSEHIHTILPITDNDMTTLSMQTPLNTDSSSDDGGRLRWWMNTPFGTPYRSIHTFIP